MTALRTAVPRGHGGPLASLSGNFRDRSRRLRRAAASARKFELNALPLDDFDAFTLSSVTFWLHRRDMVVGFFRDLQMLSPSRPVRAFLLMRRHTDCEEASAAQE